MYVSIVGAIEWVAAPDGEMMRLSKNCCYENPLYWQAVYVSSGTK